jgi:hypothetical protein
MASGEPPRDEGALPLAVRALVSCLRRGGERSRPDGRVLAQLRPDQPAQLSAVLRAWAGTASAELDFGHWRFRRALVGQLALDGVVPPDGFDPRHAVAIGEGYWDESLVLTWAPGRAEVAVWSYHREDGLIAPVNPAFNDFLVDDLWYSWLEHAERRGADGTALPADLRALRQYLSVVS